MALNNIREFVRIRKELKKRTPKLILQYLPQEANGAKTEEFQSLWRSVLDKKAGDCLNYQLFGQLWRREVVQYCGRKDSVRLFLPLVRPVGALRRQGRYLLRGLQRRSGRRRSELPECQGNLEWACVVRDQKELWEVGL